MTRISHSASPLPRSALTTVTTAMLGILALAGPAQAGTIGFETGYGIAYGSGESYKENGYKLTFESVHPNSAGSLVGSIVDGTDPFACVSMACPIGNPGMYYGAFNDSVIYMRADTTNAVFNIKGFDASFIGANPDLSSYPLYAGLLRVQGWRADGTTLVQDFLLDRPGPNGFDFGSYTSPELFGNTDFVQAAFFGYTCNAAGFCNAFTTNQGQFAIDNIWLVPEPASVAIFGLGLMGLVAARRRAA